MNKIAVVEWALFIIAVALMAFFQVVLFFNVGGFWRDEVGSIIASQLPSISKIFSTLYLESFPILFNYLLHLWIVIGVGATDQGLRLFGFIVFFSIIAALLWNSRVMKSSPPVLALSLIAFNAVDLFYGCSLRAYGLAAFLIIFFFGSIWRVVEHASRRNVAIALLTGILCVQSNFQNLYLVFSICVAGILICLARTDKRGAAMVFLSGVVALLSLLPYVGVVRQATQLNTILEVPFSFAHLSASIYYAFGSSGFPMLLIWLDLIAVILIVPAWLKCFAGEQKVFTRFPSAYYAAVVIFIIPLSFVAFVRYVNRPVTQWYYIPMMSVMAVAIESSLNAFGRRYRAVRIGKIAVAVIVIILSAMAMWSVVHMRMTNVDVVADHLMKNSSKEDLIIVSPFWIGHSFKYYFKGDTPWIIVPLVSQEDVHYPLKKIREMMLSPDDAMKPVFQMMEETLKKGGRVWLAQTKGGLTGPDGPINLGPAPHPVYGWSSILYGLTWAQEASYFLREHALNLSIEPMGIKGPVNQGEDLYCFKAYGWK